MYQHSSRVQVPMTQSQFDLAFNRLRQYGGRGRAGRAFVAARCHNATRQIIATYDDRIIVLATDLSRQVSAEVTLGPKAQVSAAHFQNTIRDLEVGLTPLQ